MTRLVVAAVATTLVLAGCSEPDAPESSTTSLASDGSQDRFPEILAVDVAYDAVSDTFDFTVTVSSPYDTPERYADGWRVIGPDGTVYGEHTLAHDHADEQPFTRRQAGVAVPDDVDEVSIEGRDLVNGFGGPALTVDLDRND